MLVCGGMCTPETSGFSSALYLLLRSYLSSLLLGPPPPPCLSNLFPGPPPHSPSSGHHPPLHTAFLWLPLVCYPLRISWTWSPYPLGSETGAVSPEGWARPPLAQGHSGTCREPRAWGRVLAPSICQAPNIGSSLGAERGKQGKQKASWS